MVTFVFSTSAFTATQLDSSSDTMEGERFPGVTRVACTLNITSPTSSREAGGRRSERERGLCGEDD